MLHIMQTSWTGLVRRERIMDTLVLFHRALLEFTSGEDPDAHMFGRLRNIDIRFRKGRAGLRFIFDWMIELGPDGRWLRGLDNVLNFDDFSLIFRIATDRPKNPQKILFYLPRGKQIYLLKRDQTISKQIVGLERKIN